MESENKEVFIEALTRFFDKPVAQKGTGPLKKGVEIAVFVEGEGPFSLSKERSGAVILPTPPAKPDLTVRITKKGLDQLNSIETEGDVGIIGVEILKLLVSSDPLLKANITAHIGPFQMIRNGYFNVLPLGGTSVMKFLASRGFSSIGKIKAGIESLRGKDEPR